MLTGPTGMVNAPAPKSLAPTRRWSRNVSLCDAAPHCTLHVTRVASQTPTVRVVWVAGPLTVVPFAVTLHGEDALVMANCSSTGANGTFGAGVVVTVSCHWALIVIEIYTTPWNLAFGFIGF